MELTAELDHTSRLASKSESDLTALDVELRESSAQLDALQDSLVIMAETVQKATTTNAVLRDELQSVLLPQSTTTDGMKWDEDRPLMQTSLVDDIQFTRDREMSVVYAIPSGADVVYHRVNIEIPKDTFCVTVRLSCFY